MNELWLLLKLQILIVQYSFRFRRHQSTAWSLILRFEVVRDLLHRDPLHTLKFADILDSASRLISLQSFLVIP